MKKLIVASAALAAVLATPAFAGDDMAGMNMSAKPSAANSARAAARIRSCVPWGSRAWPGTERFTRVADGMG